MFPISGRHVGFVCSPTDLVSYRGVAWHRGAESEQHFRRPGAGLCAGAQRRHAGTQCCSARIASAAAVAPIAGASIMKESVGAARGSWSARSTAM